MSNGGFKVPKFVVIGHRGNGMNVLQSTDRRMRAIKENSIMSFNAASSFPLDFIEFDVQVYHHHSSHFLSIFVSQ
jgi:glycerophosphodiester phosphodiesterase